MGARFRFICSTHVFLDMLQHLEVYDYLSLQPKFIKGKILGPFKTNGVLIMLLTRTCNAYHHKWLRGKVTFVCGMPQSKSGRFAIPSLLFMSFTSFVPSSDGGGGKEGSMGEGKCILYSKHSLYFTKGTHTSLTEIEKSTWRWGNRSLSHSR